VKIVHGQGRVQEHLAERVRGARVLDLGCVQHDISAVYSDTWLHQHLVQAARSVVGVDLLADHVSAMRARGYVAVTADVCHLDLGERFDVVVAGELIEHLDDPGSMLTRARAHLEPGGRLLVTTPNVYFAYHVLEAWFCEPSRRWNPEHVAWYEPFTLTNLLERHGFRVRTVTYLTRSRKLRGVLRRLRVPCWPWLASTLVVEAEVAA
jgi:2-polyprenyl-3-methyl-5-hydroxy-6-metoxy-1,4-benzoquinol methylase